MRRKKPVLPLPTKTPAVCAHQLRRGKRPDSKALVASPCPAFAVTLITRLPKIPAGELLHLLRFDADGIFGTDRWGQRKTSAAPTNSILLVRFRVYRLARRDRLQLSVEHA